MLEARDVNPLLRQGFGRTGKVCEAPLFSGPAVIVLTSFRDIKKLLDETGFILYVTANRKPGARSYKISFPERLTKAPTA